MNSKSQAFLVPYEEIIINWLKLLCINCRYCESDEFLSSFFGYGFEIPTDQFAWHQIECTIKRRRATNDSVLNVLRKTVHRIVGCIGVLQPLTEGTHFFQKSENIFPLYRSKFIFITADISIVHVVPTAHHTFNLKSCVVTSDYLLTSVSCFEYLYGHLSKIMLRL